jgi:hypothetical protein
MTLWDVLKKPKTPLFFGMGGLFLVCFAGLAIYYRNSGRESELDIEFAKAAVQIGVISIAGTVIDLLVAGHERRLKRQRYLEDLLKGTLVRVRMSYNRSKAARRKMRARGLIGVPPDCPVRLAGYDEIMDEVIDAQLELEAIIGEVETSCSTYPSVRRILSRLRLMEDYLGQLIKEYERERQKPSSEVGELRLSALDQMSDFVAKAKRKPQPRFKTVYAVAHAQVRRAIQDDLRELAGIPHD